MPLVRVLMPAYRHGAFIAQAIESVLAQKTSFDIDILIGDDGSDDATPDICRDYERRYPGLVHAILRDRSKKNDYADSLPGRRNLIDLYQRSTGEFIALLEGDDYWIDAHKLQAQVDHLNAHPEQSFCFTEAYNEYPDGKRVEYTRSWLGEKAIGPTFDLKDIVPMNFVATASVVYRRHLLQEIPPAFERVAALDWILYVVLAGQGPFGFLDRVSAVRRVHPGGVISMKDLLTTIDHNLDLLTTIDGITMQRFTPSILSRKAELHRMAIQHAVDTGVPEKGAKHLRALLTHPVLRKSAGTKQLLRSGILVHTPALARFIHRFRNTRA